MVRPLWCNALGGGPPCLKKKGGGHTFCARCDPCLGYPGAPPHVLEENGWSFLSLLACNPVWEQRIIGQPEKCIIRGGWLGASVSNQVHRPLLYRWAGKGELVQFPAALNHAALLTESTNGTSGRSSDDSPTTSSYTLCTQKEDFFPPSPDTETPSGVPVRPQSLSGAVLSCPFTGGPLGPQTCSSPTPSSV